MNKNKFLMLIIIGLVISHGFVLYMYIHDHNIRKKGPKDYIIHTLHFDEAQVEQYETYIQQHRDATHTNEQIMDSLRTQLFNQLNKEQNALLIDSLMTKISLQQYQAEKINYSHFMEIKKLCQPSQIKYFEAFTHEISVLFTNKQGKPRK
ncbi:MAG: hypothetical protein RIQ62_648 [Bacteroidota bacterium]